VAALAACLRAMGDITTCQKINDAEWTRPRIRSISGGVLANGLATATAGICGTIGVNTLTSSVGLAGATGVTSRRIAYVIGGMFVVLAFLPKAAALVAIMPRPVLGATLWFSACFVFVNGLQIVTSRMLDVRRTFVIGLGFTIGLAVDLHPSLYGTLPGAVQPFASSSLVLGTISALVLNALFRLGVRRTQTLLIDPARRDTSAIGDFMELQGAAWGARRDVIDRATFNLSQSIETIVDSCEPEGSIEVEASFDEFNLNLRVSYAGPPLELPDKRPSNEDIMASEAGQRRLAGFMLRRYADRDIQQQARQTRQTVMPPDILDGVFRGLQQFLFVGIPEFFGKGAREQSVQAQAQRSGPAHDSASRATMRRLERITRTRSSSRSLSAASTRRPKDVRR